MSLRSVEAWVPASSSAELLTSGASASKACSFCCRDQLLELDLKMYALLWFEPCAVTIRVFPVSISTCE